MSEVEKMYENAEIKKNWYSNPYGGIVEYYPPFTAEKQIELIKCLGKLAGKLKISSNYNDTQYLLYFYLNRKTRDEILPNISTERSENYEESLAGLINNLWQDLTEQERAEIRRILNEN